MDLKVSQIVHDSICAVVSPKRRRRHMHGSKTIINYHSSHFAHQTQIVSHVKHMENHREHPKALNENCLLIAQALCEPTTGLHFEDIRQLLDVLHRLRDGGNTVVIIEHNLDVIKTADWIIDLGPEGGSGGGQIIATGTPEQVAKNKASHTGRFLGPLLTQT